MSDAPSTEISAAAIDHEFCLALSRRMRGKLCEQLTRRPGRRVAAGELLYLVGARAESLYFLRHGLVKTSRVAQNGRELILERSQARLQSLAFDPAMVRLVRGLITMADTLGKGSPERAHIAHYITQEELAQIIGARREVVSGLLNQLRDLELIDYPRKGRLTVNRQALQRYLDSRAALADK